MERHAHPARRRRGTRPPASLTLTDRDRRLLAFAAEHRFVIAAQAAVLHDVGDAGVDRRLRALAAAGYLRRERALLRQPATHRITRQGLRAIASELPVPRGLDLSVYRHDLGLGWLMVAARTGRFGPVRDVVSERRMRSEDARRASAGGRPQDDPAEPAAVDGRAPRHGVRLGGVGPGGRERLHYPDMVLEDRAGHRIAFELELTSKPARRRDDILAGYAADPRIDLVVYLVEKRTTGNAVARSARRVGVADLVRVQLVSVAPLDAAAAEGRTAQRRHARPHPAPSPETAR